MQINVIPLILKYVRHQKGFSQAKIAEVLNTTPQQISKYESENPKYNQEIPVRHIITLAQLYNVSADYLLGLTDVPTPYPRSQPLILEDDLPPMLEDNQPPMLENKTDK